MNRLVQRLNRWANLLDTAGAEAVFASARSGAELARALVPVDSGALRASVSVEAIGPLAAAVTAAAPSNRAKNFFILKTSFLSCFILRFRHRDEAYSFPAIVGG